MSKTAARSLALGTCVLALSSCAALDLRVPEDAPEEVSIDVYRAEDTPLPAAPLPEAGPTQTRASLGAEDLNEIRGVRAAAVEAEVLDAIDSLPELDEAVQSLEVRETDAGLEVSGYVTSQEAFDDVIDLVSAAAPATVVESDLVVVIELG